MALKRSVPNVDFSKAELHYLSPDLLDFDPENPRFGGDAAGRSQEEIRKTVYEAPHFGSELVDSFLKNGYIDYEPLVVRRSGDRYVVVEGNRRLSAIKEIRSNPGKYGTIEDLEHIPVLVFPEQPDEQHRTEMRVYLGVRHLFGFRAWPPLSKAKYIDREIKDGGLDRVIAETRLSRQEIRRFLLPYRLLKNAKQQLGGDDFWMLGEALGRAGIKKFIQLETDSKTLDVTSYDRGKFDELLKYLYGPKDGKRRDTAARIVTDTRELSKLSIVLESDDAAAKLKAGKSLEEAEVFVDTREQSLTRLKSLNKSLSIVIKRLQSPAAAPAKKLDTAYKTFDSAIKEFLKRV